MEFVWVFGDGVDKVLVVVKSCCVFVYFGLIFVDFCGDEVFNYLSVEFVVV